MHLDVEKMAIVEIVAEMLSLEGVRNSRKIDSRMEELCDWLNLSSYRECLALICSGAVKWGKALNGFFYVVPSEDRYERSDFRAVMDGFIERSNQYAARQHAIALADEESLGSDVYGVGIVGASLGIGEADTRITGRGLTVLSIDEIASDNLAMMDWHSREMGFDVAGFFQGYREAAERARQTPSTKPIACDGCINYHGQSYGGNKLVCAIHPAGVDGASCKDWEGKPETLL